MVSRVAKQAPAVQAVAKPAAASPISRVQKPERACTPFELRLHEVCRRIPAGKVSTYGALAKVLNSAPRAVGQGLRRNPFAPEVPCHRVVASTLELGGFGGSWGPETKLVKEKKALLEKEGVRFLGSKVRDPAVVMHAEDF